MRIFVCSRPAIRRRFAATTIAALTLTLAGCGGAKQPAASSHTSDMPHSSSPSASMPSMPPMDGMNGMSAGDGLAASRAGYQLKPASMTLTAGKPADYRFSIIGPDGKPVTSFAVDQTKQMHFYAIRDDLTGYQHVHPTMAADGMWTAHLAAPRAGAWRLYTSFTPNAGPGKGDDFVLSTMATAPGAASRTALPAASTSTTVDGYQLTVSGMPMTGMAHPITVTVSRNGTPVTDLQPYLDSYAHVSAFHNGDLAFAHLHPQGMVNGDHGGPTLTFHAEFVKPGDWRLFTQFQTAGQLHTAAITLHVS